MRSSRILPVALLGVVLSSAIQAFPVLAQPVLAQSDRAGAQTDVVAMPDPALDQVVAQPIGSDPLRNAYALALASRPEEAVAEAGRIPDPIAAKLFRWWWMTLADPRHDPAALLRFQAENQDWPSPNAINLRIEEALRREPNHGLVRSHFTKVPPRTADGWLRLAEAETAAGRTAEADRALRSAWVLIDGGRVAEDAFLGSAGSRLREADHLQRFSRLLDGNDREATTRQIARLPSSRRPGAEAALAIVQNRPNADALWAALPAASRRDPALVLARIRALRRADRDQDAYGVALAEAARAEAAAMPDSAPAGTAEARDRAFWTERNILARRAMRDRDANTAYRLVSQHRLTTELPRIDAEFLAGFLALRELGDPKSALAHFQALRAPVTAAISISRAEYWTARSLQALNRQAEAREHFALAARHPATFYGQLAGFALGDSDLDLARRLREEAVPAPAADQEAQFRLRELARAAGIWTILGDQARTRQFLLRLEETAPIPADRLMAARLAADLGQPTNAAWIARRAATRDASLLLPGWPTPVETPKDGPERALLLAVMRQESNFDQAALSPAGARGLMQLMPATANAVGRQFGMRRVEPQLLVQDPNLNIALGSRYLGDLLAQFDGAVPLAVAGYNAGPGRVTAWLAANGDPRAGSVDPIDWIERIPFEETRNYVMRVVEGQLVYRALEGGKREAAQHHPVLALARDCAVQARC